MVLSYSTEHEVFVAKTSYSSSGYVVSLDTNYRRQFAVYIGLSADLPYTEGARSGYKMVKLLGLWS